MKWRNEQIYHLRQKTTLTKEIQDLYFNQVVDKLFDQEQPNQILFSYLKSETCIGYGGLVHLNWTDKNAEISFVMDTNLEDNFFSGTWSIYLKLIEQIAFTELNFHKIFTYAYDLRPPLYSALESNNFFLDARLDQHCLYEGKFIDVVIHSKTNSNH